MRITTQQAADQIGVTLSSIYRFIANGDIPTFSDGYRTYFKQEDIDVFIAKRKGVGGQVTSNTLFQSSSIAPLLLMLHNFNQSYSHDDTYKPMMRIENIMRHHLSHVCEAYANGRYTTFKGSKINYIMTDIRKEASRDDCEVYEFFADGLQWMFNVTKPANERVIDYTQLLLDCAIALQPKTHMNLQIVVPKEIE